MQMQSGFHSLTEKTDFDDVFSDEEFTEDKQQSHLRLRKNPKWDYFVRKCRQNKIPPPASAGSRERDHIGYCEQCQFCWMSWVYKHMSEHNLQPGQQTVEDVKSQEWWENTERNFVIDMTEQDRIKFYREQSQHWIDWAKQEQKKQPFVTAYSLFLKHQHQALVEQYTFAERARRAAELWSGLSDDEKGVWATKAKQEQDTIQLVKKQLVYEI